MEFNFTALFGALGLGGVAGFVTGYALKKMAKVVAIFLGLAFVLIQLLVFKGVLHWDAAAVADQGPAAAEAARSAGALLWKILLYNIPFGVGFAPGFWLGFKKG
jgi:uncharacterized membrane protein (Fun14 family)